MARARALLLIGALAAASIGFLLAVSEARGWHPGTTPAAPAKSAATTRPRHDRTASPPLKLAQARERPTVEAAQTLVVESATDAPLPLKVTGILPPKSFVRIRGLPPAASLSEGYFVRPGVWAVPLSSLRTVWITVPTAQAGRSELTISLVTLDQTVIAEAKTTLVVGAASLLHSKQPPAEAATPAAGTRGRKAAFSGPEVTLRMKDRAFEVRGRLRSYEGGYYVIDSNVFGTMTLDATNMVCIGDGCPRRQPAVAGAAATGPEATGHVQQRHTNGMLGGRKFYWFRHQRKPPGTSPTGQPTTSQLIEESGAVQPPDLTRLLQVELQRVGCDPGVIDGIWGANGKAALARFARYTKLNLSSEEPTLAALDAVKAQQGRICALACEPGTVERNGTCVAKAAPTREVAPSHQRTRRRAARARRRAERQKRKSNPGTCWGLQGRHNILVPCTDSRATIRAY